MATTVPFGDLQDTVRLAQEAVKSQGDYEMEVSFGGEKDFQHHYNNCQKNPGHNEFLRVKDFTADQLPPPYKHNKKLANVVISLADITVCLKVDHVSKNRPKTVPGSDIIYPFSSYRDQAMTRTGSGWVWHLEHYTESDRRSCYCPQCKFSDKPSRRFGRIIINTSSHLVFDQTEGDHTSCTFFYDSDEPDLDTCVTLKSAASVDSHVENDSCSLEFITHDQDFLEKLGTLWQRCDDLLHKIRDQVQPTMLVRAQRAFHDKVSATNYKGRLVILVSHPHGLGKMVSFGETVARVRMGFEKKYSRLTYTAPTCRGCSGAAVYVLRLTRRSVWWPYHAHCGRSADSSEQEQINRTGIGYDE